MKYAKLHADGTLTLAPRYLIYNNKQIFNPPTDVLVILGYKMVSDTPYPSQEDNKESRYYVSRYEEHEAEIIQVWQEAEPPAPTVDIQ